MTWLSQINWWLVLFAVGLAIPTFFLWCLIHEGMHYLLANWAVGVKEVTRLKLWPHISPISGRFHFASIRFKLEKVMKPWHVPCYALAPRYPDVVAAFFFPVAWFFSGWAFVLWSVLCGGGLLDLFVGSIGYHPRSDLRHAADAMGWGYWPLRISGFIIILASVTGWVLAWRLLP